MKKKFMIGMMLVVAMAMTIPASADRYRRGNDHPMRIIGYGVHAIGIGLEYAIMRPIHWVVSRPDLDIVFGHQVTEFEEGTYFEWTHGDYTPSIAEEYEAREAKEQKKTTQTKKSAQVSTKETKKTAKK